MNMIGMLDASSSGKYFFDGLDVEKLSPDQQAEFRRDKIGFVFQAYNLLPRLEARKQVALPLFYK
jgi:putative ABC transport system ATP-binding protein